MYRLISKVRASRRKPVSSGGKVQRNRKDVPRSLDELRRQAANLGIKNLGAANSKVNSKSLAKKTDFVQSIVQEAEVHIDERHIRYTLEKFSEAQKRDFVNKEQVVVSFADGSTAIQYVNPEMVAFCKILRKLGLFDDYADTKLHILVKRIAIREVKAGSWVFRAGDSGNDPVTGGFYSILHGSCAVYLDEASPPVTKFMPGAKFGDQALLSNVFFQAAMQFEDILLIVILIARRGKWVHASATD